jgi:hypothetical protein
VTLAAQMRLHLRLQRTVDHVLQHLRIQLLHVLRGLAVPGQLVQHRLVKFQCRCSSRLSPHRLKGQVHSSIYRLSGVA